MSTINNPHNNSPENLELQAMIAANLSQQAKINAKMDPHAAMAQLSKMLGEILEVVPSDKSASKTSESSATKASGNGIPSNAQMQQAIGQLMALLTQLEGEIAKYEEKNNQANSSIGTALIQETQAQLQNAQNQLQKVTNEENQSNFWSTFEKVVEGIVGAIVAAIAVLCGQPELAVIVIVFTTLALSGGMDKITKGLADAISKALVQAGVPKDKADEIAKVLADVIVIVASIVVTALTCGAGAGAAVEEDTEMTVEDSVEMTEMNSEGSVSQTVQSTESLTQKLQNFFGKAGNWLKEHNPFNKLPRNVNLSIVAGTQAFASTNFGTDFMTLVLTNMKDKKTKEELEIILGTVINLLAALAGAGAGASVCTGSARYLLKNIASPLKALMGLQIVGGSMDFSGQIGSGVTSSELAVTVDEQGKTQALISLLQSLVNMNGQQSSSDTKALDSKMKTWAADLTSLSKDLNDAGAALAHVLQA